MRPSHLTTILEKEFLSTKQGYHTPVMIWGAPGIGKSQLVAHIANAHSIPLIDIRLSQMEPSDLRGIPFRNQDQVEWAIPEMLPDTKRHGPSGILFLDEITSAPPTVSAAAYQLILDRRLGNYRVPEGWVIFAAGNRQGDRGVTYTMPAPLANRFSHFDLEINLNDWVIWAYQNKIDERIIAFLRFRPERLFDFDSTQNPIAFPSPRSWEFAHRALQKFTDHPPLLRQSLQACVGKIAGIELHAFIESMENMPDLDAIIQGESTDCPESIDLQYALATALVGRVLAAQDSTHFNTLCGHVLNYGHHFPQREMGVMLVSDMHQAIGERIFEVPEFAQWADQFADIMLY